MHAAEVAETLGTTEVLVPPYPGITAATGLLTSDLKYDQMRTAFMVEGAIDVPRLDRELAEMEAELRAVLAEDGVARDEISVVAGLDCRYVGQGYELRVLLPGGRFSQEALAGFHRLHELEYGHASGDPIEIVNLRVTASGRRPALERLPVSSGTLEEASLGSGDAVFRGENGLQSFETAYYDRARLPVEVGVPGPAIVFQRDTTILVPPGWNACADAAGNLILTR